MGSALEAYASRSDLAQFAPNALLLFALELRFDIDDIWSIAATAITDGSADRKCDLVYIDEDSRTAVLAQGYESSNESKAAAPANKAADLGTAASWVLGNERPADLEPALVTAAADLDQAIRNGEVDAVEFWYCHNLPESTNVENELERVASTAKAILASRYSGVEIDVRAIEIGRSTLEQWYQSARNPILVTETLHVPVKNWFDEKGDGWEAACSSVPASWLHALYTQHGEKLFSANIRSYLPRRRSSQNINFGIEQTARDQPGRFWAFNNGVTALVNDIDRTGSDLQVKGLAIVNGAQTTGSLGAVEVSALAEVRVLMRFVKATNSDLVQDIIRFNNSQNQIKPSDFRSGDKHQERLRQQFKSIPDATYLGARRGGPDDRARRPSNLISSDTAAQALAAFHQDPGTAYHDLRGIWERDDIYSRYFSEHTTAKHIVFCYSLWQAVTAAKANLTGKPGAERTKEDKEALEFMRKRGSLYLLVAAVASTVETLLGKPVTDTFALSFGERTSPASAQDIWGPVVESMLPLAPGTLGSVIETGGLRGKETVQNGLSAFRAVVSSTKKGNAAVFEEFRSHVAMQ